MGITNKVVLKFVLKWAMLLIFMQYSACISFFMHSHIVNGVTIIHSHPYQADDNGNPTHGHTTAELQLINVLSSFHFVLIFVALVLLIRPLIYKKLFIPKKQDYIFVKKYTFRFLRPPPVSIVSF